MPTGHYKRKGHSLKTRLKMSLVSKGKKKSIEHRKNISLAGKGRVHSMETKLKMSERRKLYLKNHPETLDKIRTMAFGKTHSEETRRKMSVSKNGAKNVNWKGGISKKNHLIRNSMEYKLWRESVFKRDNYTCVWCLVHGGKLNADHIKPFSLFPELRFAIDNGRTLCVDCHRKTDTWGFGNIIRKLKK